MTATATALPRYALRETAGGWLICDTRTGEVQRSRCGIPLVYQDREVAGGELVRLEAAWRREVSDINEEAWREW